jgi:poly-beta-1,6-N-acetyl-D-glucosamine synthase
MSARKKYVLLTAAYNEEAYIGGTIESIAAQTHLPERWVIVSDASRDSTDEIVRFYAEKHPFIHFVRIEEKHKRNFGAQVMAIQRGFENLGGVDYDFIGNLDADLTFEPDYFEKLLLKFGADPRLGIGGGFVQERGVDGAFRNRPFNTERSVGHAVQMVRRECYEAIGGWVAMPYGGQDWQALVSAEMRGWRVRSFPDLPVYHHRPTGGGDRVFRNFFREGRMDYSVGSLPLFEFFKLARRCKQKPYILGALVRMSGFFWGYWLREQRPVSREFVAYVRKIQKAALRDFLHLPHETARESDVSDVSDDAAPGRSERVDVEEISSGKPTVRHST